MKAHIRPQSPVALVWQLGEDDPRRPGLAAACQKAGLRLRPVLPEDLGRCIGALCDLPGKYPEEAPAPAQDTLPALVLSGLSNTALDGFLDDLRTQGVDIPLKAMVTPTNRVWSVQQLLAELTREHEAFEKTV